jgi:hypothetical protein
MDVGITYDTSDRLHTGVAYGLLLPFSGLDAIAVPGVLTPDIGIAHAVRAIMAIPF